MEPSSSGKLTSDMNSSSFLRTPVFSPVWAATQHCCILHHNERWCVAGSLCAECGHSAWYVPASCQIDPQSASRGKWVWCQVGSGPNQDTRDLSAPGVVVDCGKRTWFSKTSSFEILDSKTNPLKRDTSKHHLRLSVEFLLLSPERDLSIPCSDLEQEKYFSLHRRQKWGCRGCTESKQKAEHIHLFNQLPKVLENTDSQNKLFSWRHLAQSRVQR